MPKEYKQKLREQWMEEPQFKDCIIKDVSDKTKAFCTYCKSTLNAKLWDLKSHVETRKHKANVESRRDNQTITFPRTSSETFTKESALCLFVAQHCAISSVDHLNNLCTHIFKEKQVKIHRTKCLSVIKNVLSPHFKENLINDIGKSKYSLLIDESTDISFTKMLGVAINYFSIQHSKIVSTFLCLVELENADAVSIATALKNIMKVMNMDLSNLIGIGTDNASVMVGSKRSVYQELKKDVPSLILIKCVCHSVQLAVNHACKLTLPDGLEFLTYETYNWFSKSSKRQIEYRRIYQCINDDKAPLKIPRVCDTRWLSIETAVSRILNQWEELKLHFDVAATQDKCHKAQILKDMYADKINYAYLLFLSPILKDAQRVNKSFQGNNPNSIKLLGDLKLLADSLKSKIVPPSDVHRNEFEKYMKRDLFLGYQFETQLKTMRLSSETECQIRLVCTDFIIELIKQLNERLPENFEILEKISLFAVENILKPVKSDILNILKFFDTPNENIDSLLNQYGSIHLVKWVNIEDNANFWKEVSLYKDSGGNNPFNDLAKFSIMLLSLPWSNATVERVFSQVNLVKSKLRNRMQMSTLSSILDIRYGMQLAGKCCFDYSVPEKWARLIGTMGAYESTEGEAVDNILNTLFDA